MSGGAGNAGSGSRTFGAGEKQAEPRATTIEDRISQLKRRAYDGSVSLQVGEARLIGLLERELRDVWLFGPPHRRMSSYPWTDDA